MKNINDNNPQQITSPHNSSRGLVKLVEMDEKVRLLTQMEEDVAPVILINKFSMKAEDVDEFLRVWAASAGNHEEATRMHFGTASPRNWRQFCIPQLCGLGVHRTFQESI
jgi:hypothetical protein